ncbi:MAG: glycosyltransferase family 1 protein [Firmicutes bacterium]|nr:glycosyltransferase family 1 protein [Bacillota bacterium]
MIRILVEGMTEGKGGKEAFIMNTFRAFDKSKYSFSFISYNDRIAYQDELESFGAEIIRINGRNKGLLGYRRSLSDVFSKRKFDVVWANKTTLSSCEILEIAKRHSVPLRIVHSHSSSNMGGRLTFVLHSINKLFVKSLANEYFACSDTAAKWFFGNQSYTLIKNGIDVEKFRYNSGVRDLIRKEWKLNDCFVLGHVGRFGIEKNHTKLINVFNEVHKLQSNAKLVLCGDGEERIHIETLIKKLGLEDSVIIMGIVNNVNEVLQAMDLFVMPSFFEGLPFALLEAQAAGLKCVVSDTVSRESDVLGWNVFLPLSADDTIWAKKIIELENTNVFREDACDIIKDEGFDIKDTVQQVENIIRNHIE